MIWDSFESHYLIKKDWYQEVKGGGGKSHGRMSNFHRDAEVNYIKKKKKKWSRKVQCGILVLFCTCVSTKRLLKQDSALQNTQPLFPEFETAQM